MSKFPTESSIAEAVANGDRLQKHLLQRLRSASASEAIYSAINCGILAAKAFSNDGIGGFKFISGPLCRETDPVKIAKLLSNTTPNKSTEFEWINSEDGFGMVVAATPHRPIKYSGGKSAAAHAVNAEVGNGPARTRSLGKATTAASLESIRLVRESASPPNAAEIATLFLLCDAIKRSGLSLEDILGELKRSGTVVSITCAVAGFEDIFIDLFDRGLILAGAAARLNGYEITTRREAQITREKFSRRRIAIFRGHDFTMRDFDRSLRTVLRRELPILCVSETIDSVPEQLAATANLTLECRPLGPEILAAVIREVLGSPPQRDFADADYSRLNMSDVALAIRPGNTPEQARRDLTALANIAQTGVANGRGGSKFNKGGSRTKRPTDFRGATGFDVIYPAKGDAAAGAPRVEELAGYGPEIQEWADDLGSDLPRWLKKELTWEELIPFALLTGPPGVGKTIFARALCNSLNVPLVTTSVAAWLRAGHLDDVLSSMQAAFEMAAAMAPAILFIDEIDSIGTRINEISDHHAAYWNTLVNALLELLDGTTGVPGVIVVAATNRPDAIDPALLRAGRLHTHFRIGLPDTSALVGILRYHLGDDLDNVIRSEPPREPLIETA